MITPARLIELADKIDHRLGPIPGRDADGIAAALRAAAKQLGGLLHPTGSEWFADELANLGVPAPWRLCDEEVGEALADNGAVAFRVDGNREYSDEVASSRVMWILMAVNTLAGFKAEVPKSSLASKEEGGR